MRKPKFTDSARYPNGYTRADKTDISKTFARVRAEQKKVVPLRKSANGR